jgi:hypothetical protein
MLAAEQDAAAIDLIVLHADPAAQKFVLIFETLRAGADMRRSAPPVSAGPPAPV